MYVFQGVAMGVIPEFLELSTFPNLPLGMNSKGIPAQENHCHAFSLLKEVGINPHFHICSLMAADVPEVESCLRLQVHRGDAKTPPFSRRALPPHYRLLRRGRQLHLHIFAV
jgi:hypothetical protein